MLSCNIDLTIGAALGSMVTLTITTCSRDPRVKNVVALALGYLGKFIIREKERDAIRDALFKETLIDLRNSLVPSGLKRMVTHALVAAFVTQLFAGNLCPAQ